MLLEIREIIEDEYEIVAREVQVKEKDACLRDMYRLIDCHTVDVVRLADDLDMWLDDDGMYTSPVNLAATFVARLYGFNHQNYHGNALFLGGANRNGDTVGLSDKMLARLRRVLMPIMTEN